MQNAECVSAAMTTTSTTNAIDGTAASERSGWRYILLRVGVCAAAADIPNAHTRHTLYHTLHTHAETCSATIILQRRTHNGMYGRPLGLRAHTQNTHTGYMYVAYHSEQPSAKYTRMPHLLPLLCPEHASRNVYTTLRNLFTIIVSMAGR